MQASTIKLSHATKKRLDNLKIHRKDSYEDVILRMLSVLNMCKVNPSEARHMLEEFNRVKETTYSQGIPDSKPKNSK